MKKLYFFFLLFFLTNLSFSQEKNPFSFSVDAGISAPVKGDSAWNKYWETGFNLGANAFYHLNDFFLLGIRANYNYWLVDEDALSKKMFNKYASYDSLYLGDILGKNQLIDLSITARIILMERYNKSYLFFQSGYGLTLMDGEYETVVQAFKNSKVSVFNEKRNISFQQAGLNLGLGIKAGWIEIVPLYNIVFTPVQKTQYFTLNVGLNF